mmetsp:Transcript_33572/g.73369  ORF Transcript_33572/g.73369 Transcript_33572/m.73369 type:complete len:200 (+) Transcript_33572:1024-1623(+)
MYTLGLRTGYMKSHGLRFRSTATLYPGTSRSFSITLSRLPFCSIPSTFSMTAALGLTFRIVSTMAKNGRAFSSSNRSLFTCSLEKGLHGNPQTYRSISDGKRARARDKMSVSFGAGPSSNLRSSMSENRCWGRKLRAMNRWQRRSTSQAATTSRSNLGPPACATASCSWCSATTGASAPLQSVITRTALVLGIPDQSSS